MKESDSLFSTVRLLAMDVDGVLTDGTLGIASDGAEQKRFHVSDGMGMTLMHLAGIVVVWISGRRSVAVERRAAELRVIHVLQGVRDKQAVLDDFLHDHNIERADAVFIGDDWNDLLAFESVGIRVAVANADSIVLAKADFVTRKLGGQGAVREVCDLILHAQSRTAEVLSLYLASLKGYSSDATAGQ